MQVWVYKVNAKRPGRLTGWHFDAYFRYRGGKPYEMGGGGWIRSPLSWERLRHVRTGDLFLCYQTEERRIYGLARAATPGYEERPGSGRFNCVDFQPRGLRLRRPLNVGAPAQRRLFAHVRAFTVPSRGTIHRLAADEWPHVLQALIAENPDQRDAILEFVGGGRRF
jgi:hypothetical protein